MSLTWISLRAVELNLPSLPQFHDDLVHNIEVAHQVEAGVRVVQALVGARGVEDVQRTLATHVEPLLQERHNAPYLVPHQKVTQHKLSLVWIPRTACIGPPPPDG